MSDIYFYLRPEDMEATNAKNYHIIKAKYDKYNGLTFPYERKALDGQFYKKRSLTSIHSEQIRPDDIDELRMFLAARQNSGDEVCANCIRRLYADDNQA